MTASGLAPAPSRARRLAFFLTAVLAILGGTELLWRLVVPVSDAERDSRQFLETSLYYLGPCAAREADGMLEGQLKKNAGGDFRVPLHKTPGVRRIAFVGESTSGQLAGAAVTLFERSPDRAAWELLNCAEAGSTLDHVARHTTEVLAYAPDVLVVMFGHNWRMPAMPLDERLIRLELALMKSRVVAGLAAVLRPPIQPAPPDSAERLVSLENFLRGTARAVRERGIAVIFATATANFWLPPLMEENDLAEPQYLTALLEWTRGRKAEAIAGLNALAAARPHPYWSFVLGTWLSQSGDVKGAAANLRRAVDEDTQETDRATSAVNEVIRRVAKEEGVRLRDTEHEMERIAAGGVPGWDVMRDQCHLLPSYVADEARAILELAADATGGSPPRFGGNPFADDDVTGWMLEGLTGLQSQVETARARRFQRGLSYFVARSARTKPVATASHIEAFLSGPSFGALPIEQRSAVLVAVADGLEWAGLHQDALRLNALALETQPGTATEARGGGSPFAGWVPIYEHVAEANAWIQRGLLLYAGGDAKGAAEAFRHAHAVPPPRADAAFLAERAEKKSDTLAQR